MKVATCIKYGNADIIELTEREEPVPKDNEVLIRIKATTVTSADWRVRALNVPYGFKFICRLAFGFSGPRFQVLGTELSGVIEKIGKDVTKFKVGDHVIAVTGAKFGCHAEMHCLSQDALIIHRPVNLSFEEAAALPFGGLAALWFLRDRAHIQKGEKILINGASGPVGIAAVQLARNFGADVTGVCSQAHHDFVRSYGATQMIDYEKEDFTKNGKVYDIILDTFGNLTFSQCHRSLAIKGRLLYVSASLPEQLKMPWHNLFSDKKVSAGVVIENKESLQYLANLANSGLFQVPIDSTFPLEKISHAHAHAEKRHKKGNVVITVS